MDTVGQSDLRQRLQGRFLAFLVGQAGVNQWQFHVAQRIGARQQVERLENKADFLVPDPRKLVVVYLTDVDAVQFVSAGSRRVQATDEIHQGRFARTGRAHDGHVFAAANFQGNLAQGVDGLRAHLVTAGNTLKSDQAHEGTE